MGNCAFNFLSADTEPATSSTPIPFHYKFHNELFFLATEFHHLISLYETWHRHRAERSTSCSAQLKLISSAQRTTTTTLLITGFSHTRHTKALREIARHPIPFLDRQNDWRTLWMTVLPKIRQRSLLFTLTLSRWQSSDCDDSWSITICDLFEI